MRADLESDEAERIKGRRLHNRHVLGRFETRTCDDCAGARPNERYPFSHPATDRQQQFKIVEALQKPKGIAATDEDGFRVFDSLLRIFDKMNGLKVVAHSLESLTRQVGIS